MSNILQKSSHVRGKPPPPPVPSLCPNSFTTVKTTYPATLLTRLSWLVMAPVLGVPVNFGAYRDDMDSKRPTTHMLSRGTSPVRESHHVSQQSPGREVHHVSQQSPVRESHHVSQQSPVRESHHISQQSSGRELHHVSQQLPVRESHHVSQQSPVRESHQSAV